MHAIAASSEPVHILRLPSDPGSVAAAREHVEVLCRKFGLDAFAPVQVVSELAGNAVEHAGMSGGLEVWVSIDPSYMWIEVVDFAPEFVPVLDTIEEPGEEQERGRGLLIARMLAERIEALVLDDRKALCACFPVSL
ncbi:ATP-binding protein [Yinghuangia sp. ASG 101]|uniref:ATP-binding protein n=1 Tax=Yinghuangia sp. ASG 101 TaxID=2896848 RepID=UPI001E29EDA7|nr:ATP-binding protein [Yinghuangia sp. ASG 101]UGQ09198.1 ATP-binding protein [Yinghuangia sp. ASG 101]